MKDTLKWILADDAERVHRLLLASDRAMATEGRSPPQRNMSTTQWAVSERLVHLLEVNSKDAATITLSLSSPFLLAGIDYPHASNPRYMLRFAVHPDFRINAPLTGVRVLRYAIEHATKQGADALRSETNPDYVRICRMLEVHGFVAYKETTDDDGRRHVFLHKTISRSPGPDQARFGAIS